MFSRLSATMLLFLILGQLNAQDDRWIVPRFHSINSMGILAGSGRAALQLQTTEGVRYKNWFAGIGGGLDYYRFRNIPLFVDLRHYFGKISKKWFLYGDAGKPIMRVTDREKRDFAISDKYEGKSYFDVGGGYQIKLRKQNAVVLTAGFSRLNLKELFDPIRYVFTTNSSNMTFILTPTTQYHHRLNRLTVKAGFSF